MFNLFTTSQAHQITEAQVFFAEHTRRAWFPILIGTVLALDAASLLATLLAQ